MTRIVQKFGGTSVATIERIQHVARRVQEERKQGHEVAVVVSAMAGVTNQLVDLVHRSVNGLPDLREYDAILATGEQVSAGLLAMILRDRGAPARSWLGWQIPITTDDVHSKARIAHIPNEDILASLNEGYVAVVAGFQGVTENRRITTLGRGGSDTTAVALAYALQAERCDIYTDVDGVYSADPNIVKQARRLDRVTFEEMHELSLQGAKVLHPHAVEWARSYGVRLRVLSTFEPAPLGTEVVGESVPIVAGLVRSIACDRYGAKITLKQLPHAPGIAARIFALLAEAHMAVDMIIQSEPDSEGFCSLMFATTRTDHDPIIKLLKAQRTNLGFTTIMSDPAVSKVSIIGAGMRQQADVASKIFKTLLDYDIPLHLVSTSEIRVSVLIPEMHVLQAVTALHETFGLHQDDFIAAVA